MLFDGLDDESLKYALTHKGHKIVIVEYDDNETMEVGVECADCNEVVVTLVSDEDKQGGNNAGSELG